MQMRGFRFPGPVTRRKDNPLSKPTPPATLGRAGKKLWRDVLAAVPENIELDERERSILALAAHQADDLTRLEKAIERDGATVKGSMKQTIVNPAIAEARHARLAISRLMGCISIPDEAAHHAGTDTSRRAQKAARARWGQAGGTVAS
jgi:phage terminase small subunit